MNKSSDILRNPTTERFWIAVACKYSSFVNSFISVARVPSLYRSIFEPRSVALLREFGRSMQSTAPAPELRATLQACRGTFITLGVFSGFSNILMLTGSFFMLQIYDRVLPSRSVSTLVGLAILAVILYVFQGVIDIIRNRINVRVGRFVDASVGRRVYASIVRMPLKTRGDGDGLQPLRDLDQVRSFLS